MELPMNDQITGGPALGPDAARAEDIFRRYPAISLEETADALTFLKKGRHLDLGRVTGNPDLRANVAAFRQEHRRSLRLGAADYAKFAAGVTVFVGGLFLILGGW